MIISIFLPIIYSNILPRRRHRFFIHNSIGILAGIPSNSINGIDYRLLTDHSSWLMDLSSVVPPSLNTQSTRTSEAGEVEQRSPQNLVRNTFSIGPHISSDLVALDDQSYLHARMTVSPRDTSLPVDHHIRVSVQSYKRIRCRRYQDFKSVSIVEQCNKCEWCFQKWDLVCLSSVYEIAN